MHNGNEPISVLLADDHALLREGVREMLEAQDDVTVVGEASDSWSAVELATELRPRIMLLDIEMPGEDAASTITRVRKLSPGTAVIILSMFEGPQLLRSLMATGIRGYLLKSSTRQELVSAIRSIAGDDKRVVLSVSHETLALVQRPGDIALSPREREILQLTAEALSNRQIAARLRLSEATVKRNLRSIFTKLGAASRIDAVNKAVSASLIAVNGSGTAADPPTAGPGSPGASLRDGHQGSHEGLQQSSSNGARRALRCAGTSPPDGG
ncbi:DNA-binding response regulator [Streptomyces nigrescens]|uniref:DNA-binding response regulator n=2 Tax=Streptomyces TaxID=1883 RepID=A0ABM7ZYC3_STRNI|nr:response regulator transcription factor [Streptomyces nigrescens]MEE4421611.1 response regulator transcription factor [Streptomyces sp. DSM 41528]BDM71274.1 DNA-binding response regulator [Streptomyces nigrescens]